jgi:hypothetical protein
MSLLDPNLIAEIQIRTDEWTPVLRLMELAAESNQLCAVWLTHEEWARLEVWTN